MLVGSRLGLAVLRLRCHCAVAAGTAEGCLAASRLLVDVDCACTSSSINFQLLLLSCARLEMRLVAPIPPAHIRAYLSLTLVHDLSYLRCRALGDGSYVVGQARMCEALGRLVRLAFVTGFNSCCCCCCCNSNLIAVVGA